MSDVCRQACCMSDCVLRRWTCTILNDFFFNFYVVLYVNSSQWCLFRRFAVTTIWRTARQSSSVRAVKFVAFVWEVPDPNFCRNTGYPVWKRMAVLSPSGKYWDINFTVSPCIFYIDLICTNVCTCIYEYNITYAVTLVTLFAPTCFDHTWSSSGSRACPC